MSEEPTPPTPEHVAEILRRITSLEGEVRAQASRTRSKIPSGSKIVFAVALGIIMHYVLLFLLLLLFVLVPAFGPAIGKILHAARERAATEPAVVEPQIPAQQESRP